MNIFQQNKVMTILLYKRMAEEVAIGRITNVKLSGQRKMPRLWTVEANGN